MQLEIHVLQSFPPANLNRDENGMPKSTVFGGYPRARISSQCQKRAVRLFYQEHSGLDPSLFAKRSKEWIAQISEGLEQQGVSKTHADLAAACAITVFTEKKEAKGKKKESKKKNDETNEESNDKVDTMLFLGNSELNAILSFIQANWAQVESDITGKESALSKHLIDGIKATVETKAKPGDIALFGRMMANLPTGKVDAAVQMAHAISVNKLQQEFDFFTAVEELAKPDALGSGHMGETGYNSSTYYRFTTLDTVQLQKNLGNDVSANTIATAFAEAFVKAIPTGHQNSFAAHSLPAAVMAVVRKGQPISLVDAFENPVAPKNGKSLLDNALIQLEGHWADLSKMYGEKSVVFKGIVTREQLAQRLAHLKDCEKPSVDELIKDAIAAAFPGGN
jgi:CRISPR system Cascade subunit CasC